MKKLLSAYLILAGISLSLLGVSLYIKSSQIFLGAPVSNLFRNVLPESNDKYDLGTTTPSAEWKNIYTQNITISGTCTGCSAGSASTTLLSDSNTFSGVNLFTNASSNFSGTWQGLSPSSFAVFAYPFPGNATTSILNFNGGFISSASSTLSYLGSGAVGSNAGRLYSFATTTDTNASSTLLTDANTFTGVNKFTSASSDFSGTWQTFSPSNFLTSLNIVYPVATSTAETQGSLAYWTTSGATPERLGSVGTSTLNASAPLTGSFTQIGSGGSLGCQTASGSQAGCLSSTDWTTFNGKLSSYDPFTHPSAGISATTSQLSMAGLLSTASSTLLSTLDLESATVKQHLYPAFSYATTTAWTGSSTSIFLGDAYVKETWNSIDCRTDAGTLNIQFTNAGSNLDMIKASSTLSRTTFTTNNSFALMANRAVTIGTPATSPLQVTCSIDKVINK